jgi:hypothetical protein
MNVGNMLPLRRCLALAGGIVVLALVLSFSGPGSASAQSPFAPVTALIVNTIANAVPVRDVNDGQQPFQVEQLLRVDSGSIGTNEETVFTVPAGKRLVIECVYVQVTLSPGDAIDLLQFVTEVAPQAGQVGNGRGHHKILASPQGADSVGRPVFAGTHAVRAYGDPGTTVTLQFLRSDTTNFADARFVLVGRLVNVL